MLGACDLLGMDATMGTHVGISGGDAGQTEVGPGLEAGTAVEPEHEAEAGSGEGIEAGAGNCVGAGVGIGVEGGIVDRHDDGILVAAF